MDRWAGVDVLVNGYLGVGRCAYRWIFIRIWLGLNL